jgi:hypothetical protein
MEDQGRQLQLLKGSSAEFLKGQRSHKGQKVEDYDLSFKYKHITQFDALGGNVSKQKYAEKEGIPYSTFKRWTNENRVSIMKEYEKSKYSENSRKRVRNELFPDIESQLVNYLDKRRERYQRDKCGLTWNLISNYALGIAKKLNVSDFKASPGWIHNVFERNGLLGMKACGEAGDMYGNQNTIYPQVPSLDVGGNRIAYRYMKLQSWLTMREVIEKVNMMNILRMKGFKTWKPMKA